MTDEAITISHDNFSFYRDDATPEFGLLFIKTETTPPVNIFLQLDALQSLVNVIGEMTGIVAQDLRKRKTLAPQKLNASSITNGMKFLEFINKFERLSVNAKFELYPK